VVKNKLKKFTQINTFSNVVQPGIKHPATDFCFKGVWNEDFFKNDNPILLEIGCGKGEYTLGLAKQYPEKNFIGIDIKGDRIWKGAKEALEEGLYNVAFLRIQAERINYFFDKNEISGIWITFPDPQPRDSRKKKRLTSQQFIKRYQAILKPYSPIHLKTDSRELFDYTREVIRNEGHTLIYASADIYNEAHLPEPLLLKIQTYYEEKFLGKGLPIHYLKFHLHKT